jgi:hypothetical protein
MVAIAPFLLGHTKMYHDMSHFDVISEGDLSKFFMNGANGIHGNLLEV